MLSSDFPSLKNIFRIYPYKNWIIIGGSGDTFTATGPDDQNFILLCFVSSKPFSDWKSVDISPNARVDFRKILGIKLFGEPNDNNEPSAKCVLQ